MGIYDRDYYRREGPGFLESLSGRADVCKWLIIVNAGVFVLELLLGPSYGAFSSRNPVVNYLALRVDLVLDGEVWRLLTYAFLHSGPVHIIFNMLFLWWFGKDMEEWYGSKEFLAFYLTAAVASGLVFMLGAVTPLDSDAFNIPCMGASGAVTAVLILFACHHPTKVIYFFGTVPVSIWLFVVFQVGQDLLGLMRYGDPNIAYTAHLGGAAFALVYFKMQPWRILNLWPDFKGWQKARNRPQLRVYRGDDDAEPLPMPTPVPVGPAVADESYEELKAKVDQLLEKMSTTGLTENEQKFLKEASAEYRKRLKTME